MPDTTEPATTTEHEIKKITYTEEELEAMRQVKTQLMEEHGIEESRIGLCFLAMTAINSKLRVEDAVKKYKKLLEILTACGMPEGIDDDLWKPDAVHELAPYHAAGLDNRGSSVLWIAGSGKVPVDQERFHCQAAIMYNLAIHADETSMREGITFVIDVSTSPAPPKIGNESKMQKLYQSFPTRPQAILIAGTNKFTRLIVNASIKVASLFSKQKVLDRIKFVTVEQAKANMPIESAPKYVGGGGGGHDDIQEWVKARLEMYTKPEL